MDEPKIFRYQKREVEQGKVLTLLCKTDYLIGVVQTLATGGENNLHAHKHVDGMWMVLSGRVRFYGEGDVVVAELGKYEGVLIPRGFKYWFESVGDEKLELLQVDASDVPLRTLDEMAAERIDHAPRKPGMANAQIIDGRTGEPLAL
jgi:mannose-6-phosphate isomerase-like protein (cupin superfamily)